MKNNFDLKKAMISLLIIYNLDLKKKNHKAWPWKFLKKNILSFANATFDNRGKRCHYLITSKNLKITMNRLNSLIILPDIKVGEEEILLLIELIDLLKNELDINILHFAVKELNTHTRINRKEAPHPDGYYKSPTQYLYELLDKYLPPLNIKTGDKNSKLLDRLYSFVVGDEINVDGFISSLEAVLANNKISDDQSSLILDEVKKAIGYLCNRQEDSCLFHEMKKLSYKAIKGSDASRIKYNFSTLSAQSYNLISVDAESIFARQLITKCINESIADDDPDAWKVCSLDFDSWKSFKEILKSFFVEYCFDSNQFKNIKICENGTCQKLILEKRSRKKQFCSTKCRQAFFKKNPKNKCKDNQNQWIREQYNTRSDEIQALYEEKFKDNADIDTRDRDDMFSGKKILTADCAECNEMVSRGHCTKIFIKNPELINIQPKRKKKIINKL